MEIALGAVENRFRVYFFVGELRSVDDDNIRVMVYGRKVVITRE